MTSKSLSLWLAKVWSTSVLVKPLLIVTSTECALIVVDTSLPFTDFKSPAANPLAGMHVNIVVMANIVAISRKMLILLAVLRNLFWFDITNSPFIPR